MALFALPLLSAENHRPPSAEEAALPGEIQSQRLPGGNDARAMDVAREIDAATRRAERAKRLRAREMRAALAGIRASYQGEWRTSSAALLSACRGVDLQWQIAGDEVPADPRLQNDLHTLCEKLGSSSAPSPRETDVRRVAGYLALYRGDTEEALAEWRASLAVDSSDKSLKAIVHALASGRSAVKRRAESAAKAAQAENLLAAKRWMEARGLLREAIALDPANQAARERLAQLETRVRRRENAGTERLRALELEKTGDASGARRAWLAVLALDPLDADAMARVAGGADAPAGPAGDPERAQELYVQGLRHYAEGHLKEAREAFGHCLRLHPQHEQARRALDRLKRQSP